jgi:predicted lipoprotein with Yx(FWY)xxD motif
MMMMMMTLRSLGLAAALLVLPSALAYAAPAMEADSGMGTILVDAHGMTLYTFDKDAPGVSNCNGKCAENWPPLMAEQGAMAEGDCTLVERDDGGMMWAYKGKPLYLWIKDEKPGDTTGDGVNDVWHVAKP